MCTRVHKAGDWKLLLVLGEVGGRVEVASNTCHLCLQSILYYIQ